MQLVLPSAILMIEFFEKSVKKHNFWCFVFVCVLLRPVNNGRSQLRAGGRWCLTSSVYGDVSSQCPPLPPIVNTHHTVTGTQPQPGTTQARGNGKRRWDGFSGGKVGRDGAKWLFLHEIGAKIRTENWKDCVEKWVMWQFSEAAVVPSHLVLYISTILQLLGITVFTHFLSIFFLVILYLWNSTFVYLWISVK